MTKVVDQILREDLHIRGLIDTKQANDNGMGIQAYLNPDQS
jgi:hypothetical protein